MHRSIRLTTVATIMILVVVLPAISVACPTCKDGFTGDPATSGMVRGYFWSIVFMMSMPFLILGGISAYFYYEVRRARLHGQSQPDNVAPKSSVSEVVTQP